MKNTARIVARYGIMLSMILALGFCERQFALVPSVPAIRLGLSNAVILFALSEMGICAACVLTALKAVLGGLVYAGVMGMIYSLAGGACAVCVMLVFSRMRGIGFVGISVGGSCAHTAGQLLMSRVLLGTWAALAQSPILLAASVAAGVLTGTACREVVKHIRKGQ